MKIKTFNSKKALASAGLLASIVGSSLSPVFAQTVSPTPTPGFWQDAREDFKLLKHTTPGPTKEAARDEFFSDLKAGALINQGTVTAVNGSSLTVSFNGKTFTVNTDSKTRVRRHFFGKAELGEVRVNDIVDVWGKFTDSGQTTILARMIRDASIMKRHGVFVGTISSISGSSFVMQTKARGSQTVNTSSSTKFVDRNGNTITLSQLKVNDRVRAIGIWDAVSKTMVEVGEVKDFSIPAK